MVQDTTRTGEGAARLFRSSAEQREGLLPLTGAYEQAYYGVGRQVLERRRMRKGGRLRGQALSPCLAQERTSYVHPCVLDWIRCMTRACSMPERRYPCTSNAA
jgi:hypothetical protein